MRKNELGGWILAAAMMVAVVPGMAQQEEGPILLPKPKPVASATLLVMCDLACNWKLDGVAKGHIEAEGSAKVKVEFGQHLVAVATEDGLDKAEKELNIKAAGLTLARFELNPVRDARLKAKPAGATLLVMCDLACDWKLDGEAKGLIDAGGSAKAKVEFGQHLVIATTEDGADQVKQFIEIKVDGQTVVSIELKPVYDARIKASHEAKKADPNDPASPHAPGIYLVVGTGAERKLVPLEPCEFNPKVNGMIMINIEAVADGPEAKIQTLNTQPEFYFYFDNSSASRNPISLGSAVSPSDFALFHFTVKGGKRDALVMKQTMTAFNPSDRDHIAYNFSRIGPGAYKVTLPSPLKPGEYGFLSYVDRMAGMSLAHPASSNANSSSWIFDFGVPGVK